MTGKHTLNQAKLTHPELALAWICVATFVGCLLWLVIS